MYKIKDFAKLADVSTRTLRYYDQIGLLHPNYINDSGYRIYTSKEANILQSILFYKELGYDLKDIKELVTNKDFNLSHSLNNHLNELLVKKERIDNLINLVMDTIESNERNETMNDDKKFEAFKQSQIDENEKLYGDELREKYDSNFIDKVNSNYKKKSKYQMKQQENLNIRLNMKIKEATLNNDPSSKQALEMIDLHKEWLMFYWPTYDINHHYGLIEMYTQDQRFTLYYDKIQPGSAEFMLKAMKEYMKTKKTT